MNFQLKYGKGRVELQVPDKNVLFTLKPRTLPGVKNEAEAITHALREPIGAEPLRDLVDVGAEVALLVSDITRPCPSHKILPPLITELNRAGVSDDHITVFFATGMHRKHTRWEIERLVGSEMFERLRVVDHDSRDERIHRYLGKTRRGTEVSVNEQVLDKDFLIGVANIDVHYFAGYSGGAKSLMPGVSSFETIQQNHSLMLHPGSKPGKAQGNPVREDLEEASRLANLDFIVNVVLNEERDIVKVVAGHPIEAHRAGIPPNDYMYKAPIGERADIVIAAAGGFPKDINLYQAQKGLDNAGYAVKEGGTIILLAECGEGLGDKTFEDWLSEATSPGDIIERLRDEFVLGGHKAYAIARLVENVGIILVSNLPDDLVKKSFMSPAKTVEDALKKAFNAQGRNATVTVMPFAGSTLPFQTNA
ncbi:MAG: nickel-dependent lactate racemase [Candidatus Geothermarchaeales archaeon]